VSLALGCGTGCTPEPAGVALDLVRAWGFLLPSKRVLVIGESASGQTTATLWSETQAVPVPLREPRQAASAILAPTGHVTIAGGTHLDGTPALSVELFIE
jgi:hypothetical protein